MTEKKTGYGLNVRVSQRSHDYFHKNKLVKSGSVSAIVLNTFPAIYEATVQRLKDMFTEQELKALLSTGENYNILPESLPVFYHRIMDAIKYFKMSEKYELEKETFLEKAQSLSLPEALIAEIWVSTFWSNYTGDIEEYIK